MNKDWLDIDVLEDYLDGKLDAKSMNRVERAALEDPFVAEALAGLSLSPKRALSSLSLLQKQLKERVEEQQHLKKSTVITWQRLSIAATAAVLFISVGIIFWMKQANFRRAADSQPKQVEVVIAPKAREMNTTPQVATVDTKSRASVSVQQQAKSRDVAVTPNPALYSSSLALNSSVKGKVTDETTGKPITGANIYIKDAGGKLRGIGSTDNSGVFNIPADSIGKDRELTISSFSYATKKLTVQPDELMAVSLQSKKNELNEVVVSGYQSRKRDIIVGSSQIATPLELKDTVAAKNITLEGRIAGISKTSISSATPSIGWDKYTDHLINANRFKKDTKSGQTAEYHFLIKNNRPVDIKVIKGVSKNYDQEAIRLIKKGSDWNLSDPTHPEISVVLKF